MRRRTMIAVATMAMLMAAGVVGGGPAGAQVAGQFCRDDQANVVAVATNGSATLQCQYAPAPNRHVWRVIGPAPAGPVVTTPTTLAAVTAAPVASGNATRILSVSEPPVASVPTAAPADAVQARIALTG
jgi:hypothetical protein